MSSEQTKLFYIILIASAYLLIWSSSTEKIFGFYVRFGRKHTVRLASLIPIVLSYFLLLFPLVNRECGVDTPQYYRTYVSDNTAGLDFTFYYLCKLLHSIIPNPKIGLGIISAVTLMIGYYAILRVADEIDYKYAFMAYYTCIYFYLYNYVRIMIAVNIIFYGYSCIIRSEHKRAYVAFFLAVLFHRSAVIVLFVYFVSRYFTKYRKAIISMGCAGLCVFLARPFVFLNLINVNRYSEQIINENQTIGFGTTIIILPFLFLLYIYRNKVEDDNVYNSALYFTFSNLAFAFLGYFAAPASRLSNMYFLFHLIFFAPYLIKNVEKQFDRKMMLISFFILYCAFKYYIGTGNYTAMGIMPYY